jgi:hypothetical protein
MSRLQTNAIRHLGSVVDNLTLDNGGRVAMPNQPCFSAYNPSSYTPAANAVITMSNVRVNVGGHYNASTYRFTAPVAGTYLFAACLGFQATASATPYGLHINGTRVYDAEQNAGSSGWQTGSIVVFHQLAVGDYVDLRALSGGVALDSANWAFWSGRLIG